MSHDNCEHRPCAVCRDEAEMARLRSEVERLRGLIAEVEWVSGGYIMGPPSCPWCAYPVKEDGHAPDCPAFSARGEVRR